MSPSIVMQTGEPVNTAGSPGGLQIITTTAYAILHGIAYDLDPLDAIEEPSINTTDYPPIGYETGVPGTAREQTAEWDRSEATPRLTETPRPSRPTATS